MTSAPTTWMPLDIGDWLADTQTLSPEQHGIYLLLTMAYWKNRSPLKNDKKSLQNVSKISWKKTDEILLKFFKLSDGYWHHKRIDTELNKAIERTNKKQNQTAAATAARWQNKPSVTDILTDEQTDSVTDTHLHLPSSEPKGSSEKNSEGKPSSFSPQPPKTCRMPFDLIPFDWKAWALEEKGWTDEIVADVWSQFRDYWKTGKGRNTKREEWTASWRTWVRKENISAPKGKNNANSGTSSTNGSRNPTWKSEGQRLSAKYRQDAEREEQGAAGDADGASLRLAETVRENSG